MPYYQLPCCPITMLILWAIFLIESMLVTGAVFNLLCGETDDILMTKIENYFQHKVQEIPSWESEENFETVLKDAGLLE
jgi:hypothetical protein